MSDAASLPMGRDLRRERMEARVSQEAIAKSLGINRTWVSGIENEHVPVDGDFVQRYRNALRALARAKAGSAA